MFMSRKHHGECNGAHDFRANRKILVSSPQPACFFVGHKQPICQFAPLLLMKDSFSNKTESFYVQHRDTDLKYIQLKEKNRFSN